VSSPSSLLLRDSACPDLTRCVGRSGGFAGELLDAVFGDGVAAVGRRLLCWCVVGSDLVGLVGVGSPVAFSCGVVGWLGPLVGVVAGVPGLVERT